MESKADPSVSPVDSRNIPAASNDAHGGDFVLTNPEAAPDEPQSVGELLAHGRVLAGLSQAEVATRLRMSVKQIDALERSDYVELPKGTFLRGFVRNYAKAVNVVVDDALRLLERTHPGGQVVRATPVVEPAAAVAPVPFRSRGPSLVSGDPLSSPRIRAGIVALVVLCIAAAVWYWWQYVRPHLAEGGRPRASESVSSPVVQPPTTPAPAVLGDASAQSQLPSAPDAPPTTAPADVAASTVQVPTTPPDLGPSLAPPKTASVAEPVRKRNVGDTGIIGFTFTGESWVEVLDGTGRTVLSRRYKSGEADEVSGRGPFSIVVGNAQATRMAYNGREFDLTPHTRVSVARVTLK